MLFAGKVEGCHERCKLFQARWLDCSRSPPFGYLLDVCVFGALVLLLTRCHHSNLPDEKSFSRAYLNQLKHPPSKRGGFFSPAGGCGCLLVEPIQARDIQTCTCACAFNTQLRLTSLRDFPCSRTGRIYVNQKKTHLVRLSLPIYQTRISFFSHIILTVFLIIATSLSFKVRVRPLHTWHSRSASRGRSIIFAASRGR